MADDEKSGATPHHHHHQQMAIAADPATSLGVYANLMMVSHRKEEFILDFLFVPPQQQAAANQSAALRSRVITTPEHAKRIVRALQENIQRYEASFGVISEATDLPRSVH
jgi:acetyl-CoA acetyltransferase